MSYPPKITNNIANNITKKMSISPLLVSSSMLLNNIESCKKRDTTCGICCGILGIPVKLFSLNVPFGESCCTCNVRYCYSCISNYIDHSKKHGRELKCPICKYKVDTCEKDVGFLLVLDASEKEEEKTMQCHRDGCPWNGSRAKFIVKHDQECEYVPASCKYRGYGCNFVSARGGIAIHEADCTFKSKSCKFCNEHIPIEKFNEHEIVSCTRRLGKCEFCEINILVNNEEAKWTHYRQNGCMLMMARLGKSVQENNGRNRRIRRV
jgi:hypothetical protein